MTEARLGIRKEIQFQLSGTCTFPLWVTKPDERHVAEKVGVFSVVDLYGGTTEMIVDKKSKQSLHVAKDTV